MKRIGVIWDVDGTLVDTAEQHFLAWQQFAHEIQQPFSRSDFAKTFGWRNPEIVRTLFDADASDELVRSWGERKETLYRKSVQELGVELLPGVKALLELFHQNGWPQAVGSSAPMANLDLLLDASHTKSFFQAIISGDDVSRGKPDPEVFLKASERLGVEPQNCIVLEDAVAGVQAAKEAGMACVAVTFVGHHPAETLRLAGADLVVPSLEDVTKHHLQEILSGW